MDLTKLNLDEQMPIVVTVNFDVDSYVKRYHEYKSIWTPKVGEVLSTEREPENVVDKYVVCVKKNNEIVGKFAKTVFCFLRADERGLCNVLVKGKPVNLGDGDVMACKFHVLWTL